MRHRCTPLKFLSHVTLGAKPRTSLVRTSEFEELSGSQLYNGTRSIYGGRHEIHRHV